ncbi:MAG: HD domain-containing protein [Candidatus Marinimicrobia bacterium]|jgi:exopolyphosphatase/guanosine-5'-triphosphate,3'-diphosphate pyrophosphatase|nr:HD domain-containing protein [Candidatus Neomarinimicrobiota bacterium]MCK9559725.1 HD domain-containing protein [Candidatus Neomarinimicrobiota bacterium]
MHPSERLNIVKNLQLKYDPEPFHSDQVAKLSLILFDELTALHALSTTERPLLEAAALLHDVGYARQNNDGHHKNSLRIILEENIPGFNPEETGIVANVARYHRKSLPAERHRHYAELDPDSRSIVRKLAALLRIADGLDRSHRRLVRDIKTIIDYHKVTFDVYHYGELRNEIAAAVKKADLFQAEFGRKPLFRSHYLSHIANFQRDPAL